MKILTIIGLATLTLSVGCNSTKFTKSELLENMGPVDLKDKTVLVVTIAESTETSVEVEGALVNEFTKREINAVPSHAFIETGAEPSKALIKEAVSASGADVVFFSKLIGKDEDTKYYIDDHDHHRYRSPTDYYDHGYRGPVDVIERTYTTYYVETLCYRTSDDKLIWTGSSESFAPNSPKAFAGDIISAAGKVMKKQGLLAP